MMQHNDANRVRATLEGMYRTGFADRIDRLRAAALRYGNMRSRRDRYRPEERQQILEALVRVAKQLGSWVDRHRPWPVVAPAILNGATDTRLIRTAFAVVFENEPVIALEQAAVEFFKEKQGT